MSKMLGPNGHTGPGGRDCPCCNVPPGKERRKQRRRNKRSERNSWKAALRNA